LEEVVAVTEIFVQQHWELDASAAAVEEEEEESFCVLLKPC
jgi:hypothetical protein